MGFGVGERVREKGLMRESERRRSDAQVESILESMGKSFKNFDLAHLHELQSTEMRRTKDVSDALNAPIPIEFVEAIKMLL